MIILRTKRFLKAFKKCPKAVQLKAIERIDLFLSDSKNPILNVYGLQGELKGIFSFNVNGDYRIWFQKQKNDTIIILLIHIGNHSRLY